MAKSIESGHSLRERMMAGVNKMADAVKITIGPAGRNVIMLQPPQLHEGAGADPSDAPMPGAPAMVTNDGVSIARTIKLKDHYEDMAAQLIKEAAVKVNEEAGDGTTTAVILTQAIVRDGVRNIAAGAHPLALRRGIAAAAEVAVSYLKRASVPVRTRESIAHVAAISCQDTDAGNMIAEAFDRVGIDGVVKVDTLSKSGRTELDVREGIVLERGFLNEAMITNPDTRTAELYDPYILITDRTVRTAAEILDILILAAEEDRNVLIIADDVEPDAMGMILRNKLEGDMEIVAIKCPLYGEGRKWKLEDIAVQTGGRFISSDKGDTFEDFRIGDFGSAGHVSVGSRQTVIMDAKGEPEQIEQRIREIRHLAENTEYEFNRERHKERLAGFISGIATIQAGGDTEVSIRDEKLRIEDAINASRAAIEEGVVAGGGTALIDAIRDVEAYAANLEGDERTGALILMNALEAPLHQIAENAGMKADYVVEMVRTSPEGIGLDASDMKYKDMLQAGIADPVKVTRLALETAASVASTLLTAYAALAEADDAVKLNVR